MCCSPIHLSNEDKLDLIYCRYKNLMHHIANDILRDYHLAEDAVSQSLYRISENLDAIDEIDSSKTKNFISLITKRVAIDMYRRQSKLDVVSLDALQADFVGFEPAVQFDEPAEDFSTAASMLPEEYSRALLLKYEAGCTTKEIAQIMGCSEAKAAKLVTRARNKLKDLLPDKRQNP